MQLHLKNIWTIFFLQTWNVTRSMQRDLYTCRLVYRLAMMFISLIISKGPNTHNEFLHKISIADQIKIASVQVWHHLVHFFSPKQKSFYSLKSQICIIISNHGSLPLSCGDDDIFKPTKVFVVVQAVVVSWKIEKITWLEDFILT